ncbi:LamG domain-containing protein, partial [Aquiflexum lacus]|uniref:LamG domain-containing protein n=1 Tax=Aquiflexum lacus TaxID=2483805 RepID=UPI0018941DEB
IQNTIGVTWTQGVMGLALDMAGQSGNLATATHNSSLEINNALTLAAWVRPAELGNRTVISKADGNGFELWLVSNGQIEFRLNRGNNGTAYKLRSNYSYSQDVGEWIHVAATFDGNTSKIFINGNEDTSASYAPFNIGTSAGDLVIGAIGTVQRFKG